MCGMEFKTGDLIMNSGGRIAYVREHVARDPRWKCAGWRILPLDTGTGDGHGATTFLADYLAASWRLAPTEWAVVPHTGGDLEERWVNPTGNVWHRQVRRAARCECWPGCCASCTGTGEDVSAVETGGKCWDCRGTGHAHEVQS